ncbi:hypothetical protein BCI9360_02051 [Bacillus sp. CECT 9360]|nr:hypothetical protein BCI9360_02051 [Bacillus sp. CECT 9360]
MAAAGFIPIVGLACRALGGRAIYSTTKGINATSHALDAYRTPKSFSILQQTEMGIYGLVASNGLSEAMTGKDMFGNTLTEEQRQNSLLQALGIGGAAGAARYVDHLQAKNAPFMVNKPKDILTKNKVVKQCSKEIVIHPQKLAVEEVIRYVIKKQESVDSDLLLSGSAIKKVMEKVGPETTRRDIEKFKSDLVEELTIKNKDKLTPSQRARLWQGSNPYFGLDEYEDIILKKEMLFILAILFQLVIVFQKRYWMIRMLLS